MSLIATCPDCGKKYKVGDDKAGKKIRCSACQAIITVPSAEGDEWDAPPEEEYDAPPPPPRTPSRGGAGRASSKGSKRSSQSSGMPPALRITLIIFGVLGGITLLGCGGCYIATHYFINKAGEAIKEAVKNSVKHENKDENGNPIPLFDVTTETNSTTALFGLKMFLLENKGNVVEVRGLVRAIGGQPGERNLVLGFEEKRTAPQSLRAPPFRLKDQSDAFTKVTPFQKVLLRGTSTGNPDDAAGLGMKDATIIKADGEGCLIVSETEIDRLYSELSKDEFKKRYDTKFVLVTGRIQLVQKPGDAGRPYLVHFKPSPNLTIIANTSPGWGDAILNPDSLLVGQEISAFGRMDTHNKGELSITVSELLEAKPTSE